MLVIGKVGDEKQSMTFTDAVLPELVEELTPIAYVGDTVSAVILQTQGGDMLALEVPCTAE
jgi:hypothetical protein